MQYRVTAIAAVLSFGGLALPATGARAQTPTLRIDHAGARVVVIPEARNTIAVTVSRGDPRLPPLSVRKDGAAVVVDGGFLARSVTCGGGAPGARRVNFPGVGWVDVRSMPVITVHAPLTLAVSTSGAVWGEVGPSTAFGLDVGGCGDWRIAPVRGKLRVSVGGSGDIRGDTAQSLDLSVAGAGHVNLHSVTGSARIDLSGSGDAHVETVAGALDAVLAGSGNLTVNGVNGPVKAELSGSSDMKIDAGRAPQLAVQLSGTGSFEFNGVAGAVSADVSGTGDIRIAHAVGPVTKNVSGTGAIIVGR
jgi:hypothetical protein